ncbi:MurR/RpiR family transcriptional regulator [Rhodobacteraceae bacterium CH30]|nr:MurR/RpiR family transcriptional regulator [Rhodobacteraceae bacterium CH30]
MIHALHSTPLMDKLTEAYPSLSPALAKLADYLLRHPLLAATHSIEELAVATGTSAAAANRLARKLGYAGFVPMRSELTASLQAAVSPVDKFRAQVERRGDGEGTLEELQRIAMGNLASSVSMTRQAEFVAAVATLCAARRVWVLGFGNSSYLAGAMVSNLMPFCDAVALGMEGGNENAAYRLSSISADDVLVAISLPRYSRDTTRLARFAASKGAAVIAITDSPASPLQSCSRHVLYACAEHPVLSSSGAAALWLIEALVGAVMTRKPEAVELYSQLTESVLSYLYVDRPSHSG